MAEIQREFIRQCKFYNETYLNEHTLVDGLSKIDYCDVIKGVSNFEKHTPCQFFLKPPRMGLDLSKLEMVLDKEEPDREKYSETLPALPKLQFVPDEPEENGVEVEPECNSADEQERLEALKMLGVKAGYSNVVIPGRGQVAPSGGLARKPAMGRGQFIKSLLNRKSVD